VHLVNNHDQISKYYHGNSLGTPPLNNACKECLLRIVSDIRPKTINGSSKMSIWTANNLRDCHIALEGLEHLSKSGME
jgi:hypothetical protein